MVDDILIPYRQAVINDEPVELFDGLVLHPVKMRDYITFNVCSSILKINKNSTNDPKVISMSYLDYIIYLMQMEEREKEPGKPNINEMFLECLILLVTNKDGAEIRYGVDGKKKSFIEINGVVLHKKEFDKFRKFILVQNIPDYKEEYINPELEADLKKADEIRNKGKTPCDIEKQMMAVVIGSSLTLEEVKEMTIRKFFIALEMIDKKLHYTILKQASLSGFVEFKQEITHYLVEDNRSIGDSVVDYSQFQNKINSVN